MQQINPRIWLRLHILAAWLEEKKLAKTQRRKGRKKSLGDLAPLREQKKKISAADEAGIKIS
jgi:hypothetical protein